MAKTPSLLLRMQLPSKTGHQEQFAEIAAREVVQIVTGTKHKNTRGSSMQVTIAHGTHNRNLASERYSNALFIAYVDSLWPERRHHAEPTQLA